MFSPISDAAVSYAAGIPNEEEEEEEGAGVLCWGGMERTSKTVYLYCFPVLLMLGLLLNSVNCVMFRSFVGLRHSSFAVFMTAAGIVDSLALVSQAPRRWLRFLYETLGVGPTANDADDAVCRAFAFVSETTHFASLWVVVLIAAERSIGALLPHRPPRTTTTTTRKRRRRRADICAVVAVVASGLVLSSHVFMTWQTSLPESSSNATTAMTSATQEIMPSDVIVNKSESNKSTNNGRIFFRKDPSPEQKKEKNEREEREEEKEATKRLRGEVLNDGELEKKFDGILTKQRTLGTWKGRKKGVEGSGRHQELKVAAEGASRSKENEEKKRMMMMTMMTKISSAVESNFSLIGDPPKSTTSLSLDGVLEESDDVFGKDVATSRDESTADGTTVNGYNVTGVKSNETESHFLSASHFADNVTLAQREGVDRTANDNSERNEIVYEFSRISNGNDDHSTAEENRRIRSSRQQLSLAPGNGKGKWKRHQSIIRRRRRRRRRPEEWKQLLR